MRGKTPAISPIFWPGAQLSPGERIEPDGFERLGHAELAQIFAQRFGQDRREQHRRDAQRFGRRVERRVELACDPSGFFASFHGACSTMYLSTAESSVQTASRPCENSKSVESLEPSRDRLAADCS